jgi:hypothetical protein
MHVLVCACFCSGSRLARCLLFKMLGVSEMFAAVKYANGRVGRRYARLMGYRW